MKKIRAIKTIMSSLGTEELIIAANGFISRDLYAINDSARNFYMLGSMGLASSIGLGVAVTVRERQVVVLDGDGNILMNMGSLATIGSRSVKNLIHIVLDDAMYESTGGQIPGTEKMALERVASACGFRYFVKVSTERSLKKSLLKALNQRGPCFILVKLSQKRTQIYPRVNISPPAIKKRFMEAVKQSR